MDCPATQNENGQWHCPECELPFIRHPANKPRRTCWALTKAPSRSHPHAQPPSTDSEVEVIVGIGVHLHALIVDSFGIDAVRGCGCQEWIAQMNTWGPDGCREHHEEIIDRMVSEAKKRNWKRENKSLIVNCATRLCAATSWGEDYARTLCGKLIDEAISIAEKDSAR